MPEIVEYFGRQVELPEPKIVGVCPCLVDIYDYELTDCPHCGRQVHITCLTHCTYCDEVLGCPACIGQSDVYYQDKEPFCSEECVNKEMDLPEGITNG